jgi:glycosyltransferase involved in cell wall biosynthesis
MIQKVRSIAKTLHLRNFNGMQVGILGTRGIPNAYGGFEQFAQYLAVGLSRRGHEVFVYNSSDHPYKAQEWNGVHIVHCRDWERTIGTAGQFLYDYNCFRDAGRRNYDILLQLGYTSSSVWHRLWPRAAVNVVNMDGLEWKRSKYNRLTRRFLRYAERLAVKHADMLVADSIGIKEYLQERFARESAYIPYGAEIPRGYSLEHLARWALQPGNYFLVIARMEPENNIEMILKGWMRSAKRKPLVLIGNPGNAFGKYLMRTYRNVSIRFIGAAYESAVVNSIRHFSALYLHGHSVGGTNPSLLEAMACECSIAAHANPFNEAVLGEDARYFSNVEEVSRLLDSQGTLQDEWKRKNLDKIREQFNWERIITQYERLFEQQLISGRG